MTGMKKMNLDELEQVVGGSESIVYNPNNGIGYANCRKEPSLNAEVLLTIPNGTMIYPTGKVVNADGINWYEVNLSGAFEKGWVASSMIEQ